MTPEPDPLGIASGITNGSDGPDPSPAAGHDRREHVTNGPPSLSRVDLIAGAWTAMAAYEDKTGRVTGWHIFDALAAQGVPEEHIDAALALLDLEQDTAAAALEEHAEDCRKRAQEKERELQDALAALNATEVHTWGAAAVTFAHGVVPHAMTVQDALDEMTPTEWLLFERLTNSDRTDVEGHR